MNQGGAAAEAVPCGCVGQVLAAGHLGAGADWKKVQSSSEGVGNEKRC